MNKTTETTPQWLVGMTLGSPTVQEVQPDGTLDPICYTCGTGQQLMARAKLIRQAPRMLAALKAVCNDDLSPENLALVVEIIATAEGARS